MSISISGASMAAGAILCAGRGLGGKLVSNGFCALSSSAGACSSTGGKITTSCTGATGSGRCKGRASPTEICVKLCATCAGAPSTSGALGPAASSTTGTASALGMSVEMSGLVLFTIMSNNSDETTETSATDISAGFREKSPLKTSQPTNPRWRAKEI